MASTTMNNNSTNSLSKSQKKRMKQKAAKAKREAEQKQKDTTSNGIITMNDDNNHDDQYHPRPSGSSVLSSHDKLCNALARNGFTLVEIENAMEEMWNLGMQYDDFHAALAYLEEKKAQKENEVEVKNDEGGSFEPAPDNLNEKSNSPAVISTVTAVNGDRDNFNNKNAGIAHENRVGTEGCVEQKSDSSDHPSISTTSSPTTQTMELSSKLNVVAKFDSLYDAIVALAEWVNKAAKPHQLMSLCTNLQSNDNSALYTVFYRAIETSSDSEYESLLPPLLSLTSGILHRSGNKSDLDINLSLPDTLQHVRDAVKFSLSNQFDEIDTIAFSNAIINSVAEQICHSFKLIISYGISSAQEASSFSDSHHEGDIGAMIQEIENEIETLLAKQPSANGGGGVLELMTRRDCRKGAAEKSSLITKLIIPEPTHKESSVKNGETLRSNLTEEEGKTRLLYNLFDGKFHRFQNSRSAFLDLESRINLINASSKKKRNQTSTELESCQADLAKIQLRKEELEKQLVLLNTESDRILQRQLYLKEKLLPTNGMSSTPEIDDLNIHLKKKEKFAEVEEKVTGILDKLVDLEKSLGARAFESKSMKTKDQKFNPKEVQTKLESYLILAKDYFSIEAECVSFMKNRIAKIQRDSKDLQREIGECSALGMTTNVSKMTLSLETLSRNILEDESVVVLLREEARNMHDDVIERVTEYQSAGYALTGSHEAVLSAIAYILVQIGLANVNSLFKIYRDQNQFSVKDNIANEKVFHSKATVMQSDTQNQPLNAISNDSPSLKFSWASLSAPKSEVKSLVDIQKEELSRKDDLMN